MINSETLDGTSVLFSEEQRFPRPLVWPLLLVMVAIVWYVLISRMVNRPNADNPIILWLAFVLVGVLVPALILMIRLTVTVTRQKVQIRFAPLSSKIISIADIESVEACSYRPILHYGGWGMRYGLIARQWSYTVSGTEGVQFNLKSGKRFLVGSQRGPEMVRAIEGAMQRE